MVLDHCLTRNETQVSLRRYRGGEGGEDNAVCFVGNSNVGLTS